jgi:hypothetical protein
MLLLKLATGRRRYPLNFLYFVKVANPEGVRYYLIFYR